MKVLIVVSMMIVGSSMAQHERQKMCPMVDCSGRCIPDDLEKFKRTVGRLLSDGVCDDGVNTRFDFDCETYRFDNGDCGREGSSTARVGLAESEALDALAKDPRSSDLLQAYVDARPESLNGIALGEKKFDELFEEAKLNSLDLYRDSITKELVGNGADERVKMGGGARLEEDRKLLRELLKKLAEGKGEGKEGGKAWKTEQGEMKREVEALRRSIKAGVERGINLEARREILAIQNSEDFDAKEKKRLIAEIIKAAGKGGEEGGEEGGFDEGLPGQNAGRRTTERKAGRGRGGLDPEMTLGKSIRHRKPAEIT
ncbi:hypothetical protein TrRE_jg1673 [Triparma retinervis]|uniref:Uncharacterized protein n=1 Tax=Triparma retinervis TaxID=2557542 RepID=A0A9W7E543_9STRA|nr:hypothetical protein TrRE_jg1673 [Triparma retinervis]